LDLWLVLQSRERAVTKIRVGRRLDFKLVLQRRRERGGVYPGSRVEWKKGWIVGWYYRVEA
jgi:hypothetical protein